MWQNTVLHTVFPVLSNVAMELQCFHRAQSQAIDLLHHRLRVTQRFQVSLLDTELYTGPDAETATFLQWPIKKSLLAEFWINVQ